MSEEIAQRQHHEANRVAIHTEVVKLTAECHKKCMKSADVTRLSDKEEMCFENCTMRHLEGAGIVTQQISQGKYLHI
jgi:hypothetical protein